MNEINEINNIRSRLHHLFNIKERKDIRIEFSDVIDDLMFIISIPYCKDKYIHLFLIIDFNKSDIKKRQMHYLLYAVNDKDYVNKLKNIGYKYFDEEWIEYSFEYYRFSIDNIIDHIINIYKETNFWYLRCNYISLTEGFSEISFKEYAEEEHIIKYLFNDMIIREICSFL